MPDFDKALRAWRQVSDNYPQDPVANIFLARIAGFKLEEFTIWDGITTLEEK